MRLGFLSICAAVSLALLFGSPGAAAENAEVHAVTPAQMLALERLDQLVAADQAEAAVDLLTRLADEAEGRLVAADRHAQATTAAPEAAPEAAGEADGESRSVAVQRYWPLASFLQDRLLRWGVTHPEVLTAYRRRFDAQAAARLEEARRRGDLAAALDVGERYLATAHGGEALRLSADLALQRGWTHTARAALERCDPRLRALAPGRPGEAVAGVAWTSVAARVPRDQIPELARQALAGRHGWPLGCRPPGTMPLRPLAERLVYSLLLEERREDAQRVALLMAAMVPLADAEDGERAEEEVAPAATESSAELRQSLAAMLRQADQWNAAPRPPNWPTLAGSSHRTGPAEELGELPVVATWRQPLQSLHSDPLVLLGDLPLGEAAGRRLPWFPAIEGGVVYLHAGRGIQALQVRSGRPWPAVAGEMQGDAARWLYDTVARDQDLLPPQRLPASGFPRHTLSVQDAALAARTGPPVTGWLPTSRPPSPASRLVVLDLAAEGRLQPGFPVSPADAGAAGMEFEGTPLVAGEHLYCGVTQRDEASLRSFVVAVDLGSGQSVWRSPLLSSVPVGARGEANRVSHALVSYREGVVYYHAHQGAVAALDAASGQLRWVVRYERADLEEPAYGQRRRSEMRELSPVSLIDDLAVVMPADSDRTFAVDASEGRLLWASAPGELADVDQLLGQAEGRLIFGGDSLCWVDAPSGRTVARWPAATSQQPGGALPRPRRHGRGLMAGSRIYWPTPDRLWVFDAVPGSRSEGTPIARPLRSLDLAASGLRGGNLAAGAGTLILATDDQIAGFVTEPER